MPKKREKKTAKGRLDKFYWLAKEQGYRSRAAFKLVQLNRKYNILENARCCIDLCAAPGGWLQVASKHMPPNSLIVGVDLVPIKPIPRCTTFAEDINSFKCRDQIRAELKDWRADVVLHDGAPNVGTAWVQDAYTQSELVLQSLKLAVEFLAPGGHFVTKVFRSKDYNNLMWVFNQLFRRVEATKPPSSRNVSAEIFVVCQDFKAPRRIDPKFLDPQHVFKDLDPTKETSIEQSQSQTDSMKGTSAMNVHANVFEPEKKRRKREGYEEGNLTLFKAISARNFITGTDAVTMLGTYNQITFKDDADQEILRHHETTDDIKAYCEDLKVLGRKDFRDLMKWRLAVREHLGLEAAKVVPVPEETTETAEIEELNSDEEMDAELDRLTAEEQRRVRKERRRRNEARAKKVLKMQLQMTTPMDIGMDQNDETLHGGSDFFDLGETGKKGKQGQLDDDEGDGGDGGDDDHNDNDNARSEMSSTISADEEDYDSDAEREARLTRLEGDMDDLYENYRNQRSERDAKFRIKEERRKNEHNDEWHGIKEPHRGDPDSEDDDGNGSDAASSTGGYDVVQSRKGKLEAMDTDDEEDEEEEREMREVMAAENARHRAKQAAHRSQSKPVKASAGGSDDDGGEVDSGLVTKLESKKDAKARQSREAAIWFDNPMFKGVDGLEEDDGDDDEEDEDDGDDGDDDEDAYEEEESNSADDDAASRSDADDDIEIVPQDNHSDDEEWHVSDLDVDEEKRRFVEEHGLTTAEAVTLAQQLVNREKTKTDLINAGFSKHNFNDKSDLPSWFLDDEGKHWKPNIPVTKAAMDALRARQRALDARPIKKIAEAKARKKFKAAQRLSKAQKKAEDVLADENGEMTERDKAKSISKLLAKGGAKAKQKETKLVVAKGANAGLKGRPKGVKGRFKMVDPRMKKELRAKKRKDKRDGKKVGGGGRTKGKPRVPNGYGPR